MAFILSAQIRSSTACTPFWMALRVAAPSFCTMFWVSTVASLFAQQQSLNWLCSANCCCMFAICRAFSPISACAKPFAMLLFTPANPPQSAVCRSPKPDTSVFCTPFRPVITALWSKPRCTSLFTIIGPTPLFPPNPNPFPQPPRAIRRISSHQAPLSPKPPKPPPPYPPIGPTGIIRLPFPSVILFPSFLFIQTTCAPGGLFHLRPIICWAIWICCGVTFPVCCSQLIIWFGSY